jgi:phage terminase small subunit
MAKPAKPAPAARTPAPAPPDLSEAMQRWWGEVVKEHDELELHQLQILRLACQAWDRCEQARKAIAEHGTTYEDRFGAPRTRPEIAIESDSRNAFARLLKDLDLRAPSPLWPGL